MSTIPRWRGLLVALSLAVLGICSMMAEGGALAQGRPAAPGTYAVTVKGLLLDGRSFARLAIYSFQPDGTLRQEFWYWDSRTPQLGAFTAMASVGVARQATYMDAPDAGASVVAMSEFALSAPKVAFGRWSEADRRIRVEWPSGDREEWHATWQDEGLSKIELVWANFTAGRFYLGADRDRNAVNAGWGFGSSGTGAQTAVPLDGFGADLAGEYIQYNGWACRDEPVSPDRMDLGRFVRTSTGTLRHVAWNDKPGSRHFVFHYLARGPASVPRSVVYQVGHDSDNNGEIQRELGHTYAGLQVLDSRGRLRGFVFADASAVARGCRYDVQRTVGALYYLDVPAQGAPVGLPAQEPASMRQEAAAPSTGRLGSGGFPGAIPTDPSFRRRN